MKNVSLELEGINTGLIAEFRHLSLGCSDGDDVTVEGVTTQDILLSVVIKIGGKRAIGPQRPTSAKAVFPGPDDGGRVLWHESAAAARKKKEGEGEG